MNGLQSSDEVTIFSGSALLPLLPSAKSINNFLRRQDRSGV